MKSIRSEEKQSDVNIASHMLLDACAAWQTRLVLLTPFNAPDFWEMLVSGN